MVAFDDVRQQLRELVVLDHIGCKAGFDLVLQQPLDQNHLGVVAALGRDAVRCDVRAIHMGVAHIGRQSRVSSSSWSSVIWFGSSCQERNIGLFAVTAVLPC